MKSRPLQYLGLALLVLASLVVIFLPIGSAPEPQAFTVPLVAPKPFTELVPAGKTPTEIADDAILAEYKKDTLPGALTVGGNPKTATIEAKAATQDQARAQANRIVKALSTKFKGIALAPTFSVAELPAKPLLPLGKYAVYPAREVKGGFQPAVKLGLDLQGGVNLVMQVRRAMFPYTVTGAPKDPDAREALLSQVRAALAQSDASAGLRGADVAFNASSPDQIEVRTQAADRAQFDAQSKAVAAAMSSLKGVQIAPTRAPQFYLPDLKPGQTGTTNAELLATTVEIIRSRVDKLGVSEPLIQAQPPDRVLVQLPGVNDPQKAVGIIGQTAQMEIRLLPVGYTPSIDPNDRNNTLFYDPKGNMVPAAQVRVLSELLVSGVDVKPTTTAGFTQNSDPAIFFELQGEGARKFAQATTQAAQQKNATGVSRYIPIFLDDRAISAPTVNEPITGGSGQISGGFKGIEEAQSLALLLNSGALPAPIDVVENRTVSATLGQDSLVKSLRAGAIGLLAVAVFMVIFYRLAGMLANFAVVIYTILNLAVFILVGGTLTLPGIAGFLLALAMSLDTNILVFERLKEEMAIQPTFSAALRAAFSRAWTAILDSHVTTLIAATILFYFGTGPIKGFALTLGIGVILSLFSAISVTRLFMWSVARVGERSPGLFASKIPTREAVLAERG